MDLQKDVLQPYLQQLQLLPDQRQLYFRVLLPHDRILPYSARCLNRNLTL